MEAIAFSKRRDKIYIALLLFSIFAFIALSLFKPEGFSANSTYMKIFVKIICLNSVHTLFTMALIVCVPQFRRWFIVKIKSFWVVVFGLFLLICLFYWHPLISKKVYELDVYVCAIMFVALRSIHGISQTKGISALFNLNYCQRNPQAVKERIFGIAQIENILFNVLIVIGLFFALVVIFRNELFYSTKYYFFAGGLFVCCLLILNSFRYPKEAFQKKKIFLLSTLFPTFTILTPLGGVIQRCLHGIEYAFICTTTVKNSRARISKWAWFYFSTLVLFFSLFVVDAFVFETKTSLLSISNVEKYLLLFGFLAEFVHYFLDGYMFKFSDPDTREIKNLVLATE